MDIYSFYFPTDAINPKCPVKNYYHYFSDTNPVLFPGQLFEDLDVKEVVLKETDSTHLFLIGHNYPGQTHDEPFNPTEHATHFGGLGSLIFKPITQEWWSLVPVNVGAFLIAHVCHGAHILKNGIRGKVFTKWISFYDDIIVLVPREVISPHMWKLVYEDILHMINDQTIPSQKEELKNQIKTQVETRIDNKDFMEEMVEEFETQPDSYLRSIYKTSTELRKMHELVSFGMYHSFQSLEVEY